MTKLREELITRMINIYGYEDPIVIQFCELCEKLDNTEWNNKCLTILVEAHEERE